MEKIKYLSSYKLKENAVKIEIEDISENDFIHMLGRYSFDGEDPYGKSTGWEHINYDFVYKIKFDIKHEYDDIHKLLCNTIIFKSKESLIEYVKKNSRINDMFTKKHIDYTFYKQKSIVETKTPEEFTYYCDICGKKYFTYRERIVKNNKHTSMKLMKDGTHKCFECCNIGKTLPSIIFNLEINSRELLLKLFKILKDNHWFVQLKDDSVIITGIMKSKINYVETMIEELNRKANFKLKFEKKEKFYNPKRSETIYHYKMK